jgi:hypothetical protein
MEAATEVRFMFPHSSRRPCIGFSLRSLWPARIYVSGHADQDHAGQDAQLRGRLNVT